MNSSYIELNFGGEEIDDCPLELGWCHVTHVYSSLDRTCVCAITPLYAEELRLVAVNWKREGF